MRPKSLAQDQSLLFSSRLSTILNPDHELLKLARLIPWEQLELKFSPLFSEGPSRPPLPVRLATGLMILQHVFNVSDERVVAMWVENPYWQAFCGYEFLQWELPVHPTSLTCWRQRIGAAGVEKILQASIKTAVHTKAAAGNRTLDRAHETGWETRTMPPERACWGPNTRASRRSWPQLPDDPQETEAFLRLFVPAMLGLAD